APSILSGLLSTRRGAGQTRQSLEPVVGCVLVRRAPSRNVERRANEAVDDSALVHHGRTLVDELRRDVAQDVHTEQHAVIASEDQLHQAIGATIYHRLDVA